MNKQILPKFITRTILALGVLVLSQSSFSQPSSSKGIKEAENLYQQAMSILNENLDEKSLRDAISILEKSAELNPQNEQVWIQLSWRYWMLGDELPKNTSQEKKIRLELFEKGMKAGKKAMELNKKTVGGMYWFTVNLASSGEMKGVLSSLGMAGTLFGNMSRVDRRDPYYFYGATRRFGSEVFVRIPKWLSEKFGFTTEYIEEDLLDNIQRWPNYFTNYTYVARAYWANGEKDQALNILEYALSHSPELMPEEKAENKKQQEVANRMWKEYTGKEFPER